MTVLKSPLPGGRAVPRTVVDRICISIYESAKLNLARCRCLASIIVGVIATRSVKLNDIASQFQGKANCMSKYRRLQLFFQQVEFNQSTLAKLIVTVIVLDGKNWGMSHFLLKLG